MSKEKKASKTSHAKRYRRTAEEMAPIKVIMADTGFTLTTINSYIAGTGRESTRIAITDACDRFGIDPKTLK